jgi:hypothetical protein
MLGAALSAKSVQGSVGRVGSLGSQWFQLSSALQADAVMLTTHGHVHHTYLH